MKVFLACLTVMVAFVCLTNGPAFTQNMTDYCAAPPFIARQGPPLVTIVMGRDHKLYYEAYNDASDLDDPPDGILDVGYKHSINYYGYFDAYQCYTYDGARFNPSRVTTTKYCGGANEWSGNFLNWLSMSRADVLRKVLYGGHRQTPESTTETVLEGVYIPQDAHSWGKEYAGSDTRDLTPFSVPSSDNRHLFCVTSTAADTPHRIRVMQNVPERIWTWASTERAVCSGPETASSYNQWDDIGADAPNHGPWPTPQNYIVRVKVCASTPTIGTDEYRLCKPYPSGYYKPVGILQKYGTGDGTKVCSKTFKSCTGPTDCEAADGECTELTKMYFALLTGSYLKNKSGGVLRKAMGNISDELNPTTGVLNTAENTTGNVILTLERLTTIGFDYADYAYSCGWITTGEPPEGTCRMWGNPIAEMMYESLRYLADAGSYRTAFNQASPDSGLDLPDPGWDEPFERYPICSKPNMLVISDINPSRDSDQVPGIAPDFGSDFSDPILPDLDVSTFANIIGGPKPGGEGINGSRVFIGQSGNNNDYICSDKAVSGLAQIRGLCPEEPTKKGSYYAAAVAYYGKTEFKNDTGKPNVTTYSVALASPIPDISIKVGSNTVTLIPVGKSVSGCFDVREYCADQCTLTYNSSSGLSISSCTSGSYCPSNQIVDFYVESLTSTSGRFRINFEDVEQGADHDMDAIAKYQYTVSGDTVTISLDSSEYAAGCIDQALGFFISGTTEDGLYLPVKDDDVPGTADAETPAVVAGMPKTWTKIFTVSPGGSTATLLKDPLWYAAKWGGFEDINNNNVPDLTNEWNRDGDSDPDTYFLVHNPLKLEEQLNKAIGEILKRVSSGTAVSVLSTSASGEGSLFQAYFNPSLFSVVGEETQEVMWLGYLNALWVDQYGNLREDNGNKHLVLTEDPIISFALDADGDTVVQKYSDTNGDGIADSLLGTYQLSDLQPIWEGGENLATRTTARTIYTFIDANNNGVVGAGEWGEDKFDASDAGALRPYLGVATDAEAQNIINFIRGADVTGYRNRTLTIDGTDREWRVGDIVNATPTVVGRPMEQYHLIYGDTTYLKFVRDNKDRKTVIYVGGNDGMLHAFSAGTYHEGNDPDTTGIIENGWYEGDVGTELWAYIPYNLLPHLKWLTDPGYCHVYYVDLKAKVVDARIFTEGDDHPKGWGTVLIGAMRLGGKAITRTDTFDGVNSQERTFRSAYFAIDITDPGNPDLLWEFADSTLVSTDTRFTTSYPSVARVGPRDQVGNWYVIFGSGPTTSEGDGATTGYVYVLNLLNGNQERRFNVSASGPVFMASPITIDLGLDYDVDVAYIGASYYDSTDSRWEGKIFRIAIPENSTPGSWTVPSTVISLDQPITVAPVAALDPFNRLWLYWGTGRFFSNIDKTDTTVQKLYGVWDPGAWNPASGVEINNLTTQLNDVTNVKVYEGGYMDAVSPAGVDTTFQTYLAAKRAQYSAETGRKYGWYLNMQTPIAINGERAIHSPTLLGDIVLYPSYKPEGDICELGGDSYLYALYYETGTAYEKPVIGTNASDTITIDGHVYEKILNRKLLGAGMPTSVVIHAGREQGVKGMVQLGTGVVQEIDITPASSPQSKVIFWREKAD